MQQYNPNLANAATGNQNQKSVAVAALATDSMAIAATADPSPGSPRTGASGCPPLRAATVGPADGSSVAEQQRIFPVGTVAPQGVVVLSVVEVDAHL